MVGIIALAFGYSSVVVYRGLNKTDTREAITDLKGRLQQARKVAMTSGSRLGTPAMTLNGPCASTVAGIPNVVVNPPNSVIVPVRVTQPGPNALTVDCLDYNLASARNINWQIDAASTAGSFAFGPTGALVQAGGLNGAGVYIQMSNPNLAGDPSAVKGIAILPSGIICAATGVNQCEEDTGP